MKTRTFCLAVVTGFLAVLPLRSTQAGTAFSVGISISNVRDFYQPLAPYGHWVEVAHYGRCWYPSYIGGDWQPYADGHWEWTDQGWYWVSDEPWAWAAYHYGRWVWDPYYGWLWVPDTVWGPSWVAWREGGGYYGWAPLPPAAYCGVGGLVMWERVSWCSRAFVFVEFGRFCEPVHYRHHPHHRGGHHPAFHQTVNIINVDRGGPHHGGHGGPRVGDVERHVGRPLSPLRSADLWRDHSERTGARASLDRVTAPPMVSRPSGGSVERPQRGSGAALAPQPSQQRETDRHGSTPRSQSQRESERGGITSEPRRPETGRPTVTTPTVERPQRGSGTAFAPRPQPQRETEQRGIAPEPRRTETRGPTATGPTVERQRQGWSWQQQAASRREVSPPQWRSQPAPEQRMVRAAPESPRETRTFEAPAQREQRSYDSGRGSSDRSERSGSFGSSGSRGGGGSWGSPGGDRMGGRGGRR